MAFVAHWLGWRLDVDGEFRSVLGLIMPVKRVLGVEVRAADDAVVLVRVFHENLGEGDDAEIGMTRAERGVCSVRHAVHSQLGTRSAPAGVAITVRPCCLSVALNVSRSAVASRCQAVASAVSSLQVAENCASVDDVGA